MARTPAPSARLVVHPFEEFTLANGLPIQRGLDDELRLALGETSCSLFIMEPGRDDEADRNLFRLRGSIRTAGERIRVTVHLVEGTEGRILFGRRFDAECADDMFAFQENVAREVAATVIRLLDRAAPGRVEEHRHFVDIFERGHGSHDGLMSSFEATRAAMDAD